jgi:hypothetical protein
MSILNAIKETQHDSNNLTKLAKLPQTLIMSMAQRGEISQDMLMPILSKKAEMADNMAKMKAAEALAAQGGVQPTVMDGLMNRIAQAENPAPEMPQQQMQQPMPQDMAQGQMQQPMPQEMAQAQMPQGPEDVGIASQMTAPMQMAGGGIIAFDEGGDVDEDDERNEDAREQQINEYIFDMLAKQQGGDRGEARSERRSGGDDLEARLRAAIMQRESGGRRYGKDGNLLTSSKGAQGEMQVMPGTARDPGFGVKAARSDSPDELRRVGDEYASMLLNRYQDPKLAMIAYNMGPGATDKWLASGADVKKLPKETQSYIRGVNLAQGGEVRRYAGGGTMGGFDDAFDEREEEVAYDPYFAEGTFSGYSKKAPRSQVNPKAIIKKPSVAAKKTEPAKTVAAPAAAPAEEAPKSRIPQSAKGVQAIRDEVDQENFSMMDYIKRREAKMEADSKQDYALAGLAAGLGMMAGTSPYALSNIGQGGLAGVQQLSQTRKGRAAQEAALGKLYGSAAQADTLNKIRRDQLAQGKDLARDRQDQSLLTAKNEFIAKRLKSLGMDEMMLGTLRRQKATGKLPKEKLADLEYYEQQMRDIDADAERRYSNPRDTTGFSARRIG